jgi:hypothetical protein
MFKKWFGPKPKPATVPEVQCPLSVGQKLNLTDHVEYEIVKIGEKREYSDSWPSWGKAIVKLPGLAENIRIMPTVNAKYGSVEGYCVIYNLPDGNEHLIEFGNQWSHTETDNFDRELNVSMHIEEVETK